MPQGKLKVKTKAPAGAKAKKKATKGPAATKRANRPITPKKQQQKDAQKLKKAVTKTINESMEDDLRARALDGKKSLTKKQPAKAAKTAKAGKGKKAKK